MLDTFEPRRAFMASSLTRNCTNTKLEAQLETSQSSVFILWKTCAYQRYICARNASYFCRSFLK